MAANNTILRKVENAIGSLYNVTAFSGSDGSVGIGNINIFGGVSEGQKVNFPCIIVKATNADLLTQGNLVWKVATEIMYVEIEAIASGSNGLGDRNAEIAFDTILSGSLPGNAVNLDQYETKFHAYTPFLVRTTQDNIETDCWVRQLSLDIICTHTA